MCLDLYSSYELKDVLLLEDLELMDDNFLLVMDLNFPTPCFRGIYGNKSLISKDC